MRNVFLLYMPPGNAEAMVHYQDTIKNRVPLSRVSKFISQDLRARLISIFGGNSFAVWGSRAGSKNRSNFAAMQEGDEVLIIEGDTVRFLGKLAAKTQSVSLSQELWKPIGTGSAEPWELVYFIANPCELSVPFDEVCSLFGYKQGYRLRGFTTVAAGKLETFYSQYDDLYSILLRLQRGENIAKKETLPGKLVLPPDAQERAAVEDESIPEELVSDHVTMQWKLARLGLKANERVWVPVGDQLKLQRHYQFNSFDDEFQAGLDLPHSYVENIDVVWKQEFRIGAAYEIENSTSIYSGLLRFADLNILAPNTLYPMFIVAPAAKKNRVRDQLRRPTFRRLELDKKVRFLSYETIDEIDSFFSGSDKGLTIDLIQGKAELVA